MRVLIVHCHPVPESFSASLRDTAIAVLTKGAHEVRLLDLYAEKFDPVMTAGERRTYNDGAPSDPVLLAHAEHLRWAEGLIFIYPTWWYGLPAMLKGWLDRVWTPDIAFAMPVETGVIKPLLTHIRLLAVITTCGAPWWWSHLMGHPGRRTILRGIRALCARRCKTVFLAHYLMDVSTPETRAAFVRTVEARLSRL